MVLNDIMAIDLWMLKYRSPELESKAVESIIRNTEYPYRLHLIDNRQGPKNMARLWNRFIFDSKSDFVCILDSDVVVESKWLTRLVEVLTAHSRAAAVLPVTDNCSEVVQRGYSEASDQPPGVVPDGMVSGFLFLLRKSALVDVGFFDEQFEFYGQDTEFFCRTALTTDWQVWVHPGVFVHHESHGSLIPGDETHDFQQDKKRALERFFSLRERYRNSGH